MTFDEEAEDPRGPETDEEVDAEVVELARSISNGVSDDDVTEDDVIVRLADDDPADLPRCLLVCCRCLDVVLLLSASGLLYP